MTPADNEALREELHDFAINYHVLDGAGRTADLEHILDLITRHTQAAEVAARIDEVHVMLGYPKEGEFGFEAVERRLAELKAARKETNHEE